MRLKELQPKESYFGFRLIKKEDVASKNGTLYTLFHEKTGAELLYFDRDDENKTFAIGFQTLPEDHTGVFHILEHSVLNGSRKFPVKEPFLSMLQNSMQTFLNAMTFSDKTLYPVSSRNEQDFFHLMEVYLDAVFCPMIYERPEIFMQEGWHYAFDAETPYYNGVVYSEMKGAFADLDTLLESEMNQLLYPDTCYGYVSGGHPDHITDLSYEQFLNTHRRFYHPSNAKIFLDGQMDMDRVLEYLDREYLSKYEYRKADFAFQMQIPKTGEKTVFYEAAEGEEELSHMVLGKILGTYEQVETYYAAKILGDCLTGSNEAPLKRVFLEKNLAQDVNLLISESIYQPKISFEARNTSRENFKEIKDTLFQTVRDLAEKGLSKESLLASLERFAFVNKEITGAYGVELAIRALDGWLYGADPLTHIANEEIIANLRKKVETDYYENLLLQLLGNEEEFSSLYALPSLTKGREDAEKEQKKLEAALSSLTEEEWREKEQAFQNMQQWQQMEDSEEALATLPHLDLKDIPREGKKIETVKRVIAGREVLETINDTNGILYVNLYFDISDFTMEELRMSNVLTACMGELRTEHYGAEELQIKIKSVFGNFATKMEVTAKPGDLETGKVYFAVYASMLEEKAEDAFALLEEILLHGYYDETDRIYETVLQNDYFMKQSLISDGHIYAMTKALAPYSWESAIKEELEGENFLRWFGIFAETFLEKKETHSQQLSQITKKAFSKDRLFAGYSGSLDLNKIETLILSFPEHPMGETIKRLQIEAEECKVQIPGSMGFSAKGHNLYALEGQFSGSCAVLSSLMSFGYLWNRIRVQGGAYGTGMGMRMNGDMYCYSYRDPDLSNSKTVYTELADFLEDFVEQEQSLDDLIIGAVNGSDPLLAPAALCDLSCVRYLKGITEEDLAIYRTEILDTTVESLKEMIPVLRAYEKQGKTVLVQPGL